MKCLGCCLVPAGVLAPPLCRLQGWGDRYGAAGETDMSAPLSGHPTVWAKGEPGAGAWETGEVGKVSGCGVWALASPQGRGVGGTLGDTGVEGAELLGLHPALQPSLSPVSSPGNDGDSCEMKCVCDRLRVGPEGAQA